MFSSLKLAASYKNLRVSVDLSTSKRTYKEIKNESKIGIKINDRFQSLLIKRLFLIIWAIKIL